ncbi:hypothetical protein EG68_05464 [Paragonimus skrjabini miyazakii]|uniref:Cytoplasmic tRNA 2-thiolation protein 2 n=1 Tax=Paragonimus skrjabini miyazakii TaxID=59628 RepID=A0A8S9YPB2_9TREM|nr:hypothetical protein EG68_05464 [Paragonimus skrjabini miyazakii]
MRTSGFEYYTLDAEQMNLTAGRLRAALHLSSSQSITTLKNLPNADKWIRRVLLAECARLLNCGFLCLGDSGTRVASSFLVGVIEGRGGHSCMETTFLDQRFGNIAILRPLRDFMIKELVFYARFSNLNMSTPRDLVTQTVLERPGITSVPRLCEDFLLGLQAPITRPSDIPNPNKLAMASLLFSRSVAQLKHSTADYSEDNTKGRNLFEGVLCFSCSTIYEELPNELKPAFEESFLNVESSASATN